MPHSELGTGRLQTNVSGVRPNSTRLGPLSRKRRNAETTPSTVAGWDAPRQRTTSSASWLFRYRVRGYLADDPAVVVGPGWPWPFFLSLWRSRYPLCVAGSFTGPLLAAYLVTFVTSGTNGMRILSSRYVQWRVGILWYVVALFGYFLVWLAGYSVWLNGAPLFALVAKPRLIFGSYLALFALLLTLAFGEETGWRGFALPRLQERYGPLPGTLILGSLHGLWHLPALLVPGFVSNSTLSAPFIARWIATAVAATVLYTWIFNNSSGSLLIAILVHAGSNASSSLLGALVPDHPILHSWQAAIYNSRWNLANLIPFAISAMLLIVSTRGRLGYPRNLMWPSGGSHASAGR